jgi:hypothetical protein
MNLLNQDLKNSIQVQKTLQQQHQVIIGLKAMENYLKNYWLPLGMLMELEVC